MGCITSVCSCPGSPDDQDGDGYTAADGDCNDFDAYSYPSALEIGDGVDNDCDGQIDEDVDPTLDFDKDGYTWGAPEACPTHDCDCDDGNRLIHPGASEVAYDSIDQDCNGLDLNDIDGDGFTSTAVGGYDCNDIEDFTHPDAPEIFDGRDNDCDGPIDESVDPTRDFDGDGYSRGLAEVCSDGTCDCDDSDPFLHPNAEEQCDGIDNDCDGRADSSGCSSTITIRVSTGYGVYGDNPLAAVREGEDVFLVGNFTAWNPNYPGFEMSDPERTGIWSISLTFPLSGYAYNGTMIGTPTVFDVGDTIEFKFAKTSDCDVDVPYYDGSCWSEGQKEFLTHQEATDKGLSCADDTHGGLWEIHPGNYSVVVPAGPMTVNLVSDAWLGTALEYDLPICE
jgi:hypothetical protein